MTITQIKYFITVANCLSITKAAEQLFISQPALSRHIRNMEEELNIQLFIRTKNGIRLTPAGSHLFMGMSELYQDYSDMVTRAKNIQRGMMGTLSIGILEKTYTADFMPQMYQYFHTNHPDVELKIMEGSFRWLLEELYAGKLDAIFTLQFEVEQKESIIYQHITHSDDFIVVSKHHPLGQREFLTLDDLKNETFLMISPEDNPESSKLILDMCREHGFVPSVHYAKTMSEQALWIASGMGVSILDSRCEMKMNPDINFFRMDSNWDPSLVFAWNQHNYNPLISEFLKKLNSILDLENEDLHGASID